MQMLGCAYTIYKYGNEEVRKKYVQKLCTAEYIGGFGITEPDAGSDVMARSSTAEDKGDHWLVNGQKVWTSGANLADWCFCLVRTDTSKKHEGISVLLIDMRSPGVEVRPILLINGGSPFCETFFTDVKVPKDQLVGRVNGGWDIAKRLLQFERSSISAGGFGGTGGSGCNSVCRTSRR
jgi:alkylation response protein AidB-like acyl-CoA dehydrogenase